MQFTDALKRLREDTAFAQWSNQNKDHYLAHAFFMKDAGIAPEWQIGFYNRPDDRIVVFTLGDEVRMNPPSEVFKKDSGVKELVEKDVLVEFEDALAAAEQHRLENYKAHTPIKTIVLLQKLKVGQVWNISFVTNTFTVCNVKIDTKTKKVLSASCESLLGWAKKE